MIIIPVCTFLISAVSVLLMLRDMKEHCDLYKNKQSDSKGKFGTFEIVYCTFMFALTVAASFLFVTVYKDNSVLLSIKRMALLSVIWPLAYIDAKTYRIPNAFIVFGLICRVIILAFEMIFEYHFVWSVLVSEVVTALALLFAALLCSLCIKNSIGFGDIKLFVVMGLLLGFEGIWGAIIVSLIVTFIMCVYVLVTKKKSRKDSIPFAPAIVIGTYLSVCLSGM